MSFLHVFCLKFLPRVALLWRQLPWRCAASLVLRLLSLAPMGLLLLAPVRMLLAPVRMLWLLAPILLAPIVVLLAPFAALTLRLIMPTFTSTLIHIVE